MLELKNSKTTRIGAKSFSLDGFISPIQMKEPEGQWEDIKPYLVRDNGGWHIEGAPYYAEVKDDGTRLFCPDKHERSRYIRLAMPLISGLEKYVISTPAVLDGQILPNRILMLTSWGKIHFIFTNTALKFEVLFNEAPSFHLLPWTKRETFIFDVESSGLDISKLLTEEHGLGIPKPRLIEADETLLEPKEKMIDWSFNDGQLELGFDLAGLEFPILLKNTTIDEQIDAGANDGFRYTGSYGFQKTWDSTVLGYHTASAYLSCSGFYRFTGITIDGEVITSYLELNATQNGQGSPTLKIYGIDEDNPSAPTSAAEFDADPLTSAAVDWDGAWSTDAWEQSPSVNTILEELRASYTIQNDAIMFQIKHDGAEAIHLNKHYNYEKTGNELGCKLHIEYGASAAERGWWSK